MSKLPRISGMQAISALCKAGYVFNIQTGSHIVLKRSDPFGFVVVPDHKELDTGTLRAIIRQADLSVEDFLKLL
jgi:predicted RNA binding protein YcfA (HicA-like mRNA interferase family)